MKYENRPFLIIDTKSNKIILRYETKEDAEKFIEGLENAYKNYYKIIHKN